MGVGSAAGLKPIPTLTLPLKGRESFLVTQYN
jgi:hypothetical protein